MKEYGGWSAWINLRRFIDRGCKAITRGCVCVCVCVCGSQKQTRKIRCTRRTPFDISPGVQHRFTTQPTPASHHGGVDSGNYCAICGSWYLVALQQPHTVRSCEFKPAVSRTVPVGCSVLAGGCPRTTLQHVPCTGTTTHGEQCVSKCGVVLPRGEEHVWTVLRNQECCRPACDRHAQWTRSRICTRGGASQSPGSPGCRGEDS